MTWYTSTNFYAHMCNNKSDLTLVMTHINTVIPQPPSTGTYPRPHRSSQSPGGNGYIIGTFFFFYQNYNDDTITPYWLWTLSIITVYHHSVGFTYRRVNEDFLLLSPKVKQYCVPLRTLDGIQIRVIHTVYNHKLDTNCRTPCWSDLKLWGVLCLGHLAALYHTRQQKLV